MTGVFVLDKPAGFTSFDAVAVLRGLLGERKIGHTGTLDPMATGVLPLLLGKATRALPFLAERKKAYEAEFALGRATDTLDSTGHTLETDRTPVSREMLERALPRFRGAIEQVPPMFSALRRDGVRLYDLARQGKTVARAPRPVTIFALTLLDYDEAQRTGRLAVTCSGGTYIRTLIDDLGRAVGSHGVMTGLRRTASSGFTLADAVTMEKARRMQRAELSARVLPVETLFADLPAVAVSAAQARRFRNGGALDLQRLSTRPAGLCRVHAPGGGFLGLGAPDAAGESLRVQRLFGEETVK